MCEEGVGVIKSRLAEESGTLMDGYLNLALVNLDAVLSSNVARKARE